MIPDTFNIHDDIYIINAPDPKTVLSLNGCRVTDKIRQVVKNEDAFCYTLRFFKLWAKKRAVYSNVMGYLGGVSWAILVAHVCQLYPTAQPIKLIKSFFKIYHFWKWPAPIELVWPINIQGSGHTVWEQVNNPNDLMPIITPSFPCMNSTYNISRPTKKCLIDEFARGREFSGKLDYLLFIIYFLCFSSIVCLIFVRFVCLSLTIYMYIYYLFLSLYYLSVLSIYTL